MQLSELFYRGVHFFKTEPIIGVVALVIVALLFYFKKRAMFRILALFLVAALVYYFVGLIGQMTTGGTSLKDTAIERTPKELENQNL